MSVSGCRLQSVLLVTKRIFPHFQEYFSFRNSTLAFKNYSLELYIAAEHFFMLNNTFNEWFVEQTQIRSDASSCQTVTHFVLEHSSKTLQTLND